MTADHRPRRSGGKRNSPDTRRFYEIVAVCGTTLKSVIQEKFGYGIMSAIDFKMVADEAAPPARPSAGASRWTPCPFLRAEK